MKYCKNPNDKVPIMLLDKTIGANDSGKPYIDGNEFANELMELDAMGKSRIDIWINSFGGSVADGMRIYNAMLSSRTPVDTYNLGIACSISAVLFQAGRKRIMADYAQLMFHDPKGGDKKSLEAIKDSLVVMIANRCGKPSAEVSELMGRETWMGAIEAKNIHAMCDVIQSTIDKNKPTTVSSDVVMLWAEGNSIINNFFITSDMNKEQKLALGLKEDATDEQVMNAINELKNARALVNEKNNPGADELKKLVTDTITATLKPLQDTITNLQTADQSKVKAELKVKATALINSNLNRLGDLTDELKNEWISKAENDYDGMEKLIALLPLKAVDLSKEASAVKLKEGELPCTAAGLMAQSIVNMKNLGMNVPTFGY